MGQKTVLKKEPQKRYPNLGTVLMVEEVLEENQSEPMKLSELKTKLPKQVMHQTLLIILEYLWNSGKILYGPKGLQWIYSPPKEIEKLMEESIEL